MEHALAEDASYVVQQLAALVRKKPPVMDEDSLELRDAFAVVGIFPIIFGCGLLGRYAGDGVVDVSKSGGFRACAVGFG
jgi:hypothetical protein